MGFPWWNRGSESIPANRRGLRRLPELTTLEDRRLLTVASLTAVADPKVLVPNRGQFVPVIVSGTVEQIVTSVLPGHPKVLPPAPQLVTVDAANSSQPAPVGLGLVTDQYRQVEPRVHIPLTQVVNSFPFFVPATAANPTAYYQLVRTYSYSFTVNLQAKASSIGRQYDITVFAGDHEAGAQKTIFVVVPHGGVHARGPHPRHSSHATAALSPK